MANELQTYMVPWPRTNRKKLTSIMLPMMKPLLVLKLASLIGHNRSDYGVEETDERVTYVRKDNTD